MAESTYTVNDLPSYSRWPARLLGIEPWQPRQRTRADLLREYDQDEWGGLLRKLASAKLPITMDELDALYIGDLSELSLRSWGEELSLLSEMESRLEHQRLVETSLEKLFPASAVVEFGAGYGGMILRMASSPRFRVIPLLAGELTRSGREVIQTMARASNLPVTVGHCDLGSPDIADFPIPEGALIFTSFALTYLSQLDRTFFERMAALKPKAVVHFEPFHEHFRGTTMLSLLRRRYLEVNDYNLNALTVAHEEQRAGRIRILREEPNVYGGNPLLPVSVLAWAPAG